MYTYVNDTKLTNEEWNEIHIRDCEFAAMYGELVYENSYSEYCKTFDEQMAVQIATRDWLRKEYVRLMKAPFDNDWAHAIGDFNESFKDCFGVRSWFYGDMLKAKGITADDVIAEWRKGGRN